MVTGEKMTPIPNPPIRSICNTTPANSLPAKR